MKVVFDTNVLISAALKEQSPPSMAARIVAESNVLLKSTITEQELFVTLDRPRLAPLIPSRFRDWLGELLAAAELVTITARITACRNPKDDIFLELAVNGHADLIVSGDADLLSLNPFRGIPLLRLPASCKACAINPRSRLRTVRERLSSTKDGRISPFSTSASRRGWSRNSQGSSGRNSRVGFRRGDPSARAGERESRSPVE